MIVIAAIQLTVMLTTDRYIMEIIYTEWISKL